MKFVLYFLLCFIASNSASSQQYAVSEIPESLLTNANVVKRIDEHHIQVKDAGKAIYHYKTVYTILKEHADDVSQHVVQYDKFRKIIDVKCTLYDASGVKLKSLKKADVQDLPGEGAGTEISDSRFKRFGFYHKIFPYTIEYEVIVELDGLMQLPAHYFVERESMSVENSTLTIRYPENNGIRFKAKNYQGTLNQSMLDGDSVISWKLQNMPAVKNEIYAPEWYELTPVVYLAMKDFSIAGYSGSNNSWESVGNFMYRLKQGRDELPPSLKEKVHAIARAQDSKSNTVKALYKFLQENTRYISVQLGIGGWQPFDAKFVYEHKYGDCKALTNYMYALLKEVGIYSDYALVYAGDDDSRVQTDFPSSQFNHVILCVPLESDTLWLECTSAILPPGYLGDFTANRPALLVKEKGSCLVNTPGYNVDDNQQINRSNIKILSNGQLDLHLHTTLSGLLQDDWQAIYKHEADDQILSRLHRAYTLGTYKVNQFHFEEKPGLVPIMEQYIDLSSNGYAQRSGKRIFVMPNLVNKQMDNLQRSEDRINDVVIKLPYQIIDTTIIEIPVGFAVETIPGKMEFFSPFGSYSSAAARMDNRVYYYRKFIVNDGKYPAADFSQLVKWFADINKADRSNIVFVEQ